MAFYDEPKKKQVQSDFPTSPEVEENDDEMTESESDAFSKWVRDRLRSGKRRMVEIE